MTASWALSHLSAALFAVGVEGLLGRISNFVRFRVSLSKSDLRYIHAHTHLFPQSYSQYGLLFEVVWMADGKAKPDYFIRPVGFGQTPAHAIVNSWDRDTEGDRFNEAVTNYITDREKRFLEAARAGARPVDRQAVWLQYNTISRDWTTELVSLEAAEEAARVQISALESLRVLAANSQGLEKLHQQANFWNQHLKQFEAELRIKGQYTELGKLVDANNRMVADIDTAIRKARDAEASAEFFRSLGILADVFNLGAQYAKSSSTAADKADAARDYHKSSARQIGEAYVENNNKLGQNWRIGIAPGSVIVLPKVDYDGSIKPLLLPGKP